MRCAPSCSLCCSRTTFSRMSNAPKLTVHSAVDRFTSEFTWDATTTIALMHSTMIPMDILLNAFGLCLWKYSCWCDWNANRQCSLRTDFRGWFSNYCCIMFPSRFLHCLSQCWLWCEFYSKYKRDPMRGNQNHLFTIEIEPMKASISI